MCEKYPKPNILLLDMPEACATAIRTAGYNASTGSLGTPYIVPESDSMYPITLRSCHAPRFEEQEIVIANLMSPAASDEFVADKPGDGVEGLWEAAVNGEIDPRPVFARALLMLLNAFSAMGESSY